MQPHTHHAKHRTLDPPAADPAGAAALGGGPWAQKAVLDTAEDAPHTRSSTTTMGTVARGDAGDAWEAPLPQLTASPMLPSLGATSWSYRGSREAARAGVAPHSVTSARSPSNHVPAPEPVVVAFRRA
jgi:hypothetical protein